MENVEYIFAYQSKLKEQDISIGDVISFDYYVSNYGNCTGKGIIEVHFNKYNRPEVKVRFIEDSYEFYWDWTFELDRLKNIKKIEMSIGEKIALIQLSKYNRALAHIKSRWFNEDRKILEDLWKKHSKSKHRTNKVIEDFIISKEERKLNSNCQYNAYYCHIWIAEFTKQKTITKELILGLK
ncbi:hypothetical protein N5U23_04695 [Aliarcobacter butzleri]|uniref:hypothetical protein n=1 Tax=Aliarcobacter butzleri TaxID=28197 RepID=UPI0021B178A8|nr:hypothetical protein [Aliarcobacter butzleri]MCT7563311.1 hypothetical protein [Aliarcobacter butzleri]MCT7648925.1 hypothetical protein [Aliarcobacter butzleri]